MRILGEQRRKRDESEASVKRESLSRGGQEPRGGAQKIDACTHTIVQVVPGVQYERGYPIGYFTSRDPRMFFKDVTRSHIYSLIT